MGGLDEFWMDNATARAQFFLAKKDWFWTIGLILNFDTENV